MLCCFTNNKNTRSFNQQNSVDSSAICRICHDGNNIEELVNACQCSGSVGLIHVSCLEKWLITSHTQHCELCNYEFLILRRNRPLSHRSLFQWFKSTLIHQPRILISDIIFFLFLTPMCIIATYLCGLGAIAYGRQELWESIGLIFLCSALLTTYFIWLFVTLRLHIKSWKQWCEQHQDIKLLVTYQSSNSDCRNRNCDPLPESKFSVYILS